MTSDVEGWYADPASNYGLSLLGLNIGNPTFAQAYNFNNTSSEFHPILEVTAIPELSTSALLAGVVALFALMRRQRSRIGKSSGLAFW